MNDKLIITDGTEKIISFHFYSLDEKNELEITFLDSEESVYINLTQKQQKKIYKFLKKRNEK